MKDDVLHIKYKAAMGYIENGHAKRIPKEQLVEVQERPVWYLPHHPVVHPLKEDLKLLTSAYNSKWVTGNKITADFAHLSSNCYKDGI